jgi:hypothetical protein
MRSHVSNRGQIRRVLRVREDDAPRPACRTSSDIHVPENSLIQPCQNCPFGKNNPPQASHRT